VLFLRSNQLETLPFAIGNCTSLTALDIRDNPLLYLPFSTAKLPMEGTDFYLDVPCEVLLFPPGKVSALLISAVIGANDNRSHLQIH
jgi:hypothetical protein